MFLHFQNLAPPTNGPSVILTNFKMEKMISELNGKLKALSFRTNKTDEIIAKSDKEALERHQASITNITEAVSTQKESIKEKKFSKGESEEEVSVWGAKAEELLAEADDE